MKQQFFILALLGSVFFTACSPNTPSSSEKEDQEQTNNTDQEEAKQVEPETIFENDYTKVVRVQLKAGETLASHKGNKRLVYALADYSIEWTSNGESKGQKDWKKGDVHVHEADEHSAKNAGSSTAEWLAFVLQKEDMPKAEASSLDNDVSKVAKDFAKIVFENDDFRVTEVNLPANEKIPAHEGPNRIIYSLSSYNVRYQDTDQDPVEETFKKGDVHWHKAGSHALENIGKETAQFLIVALK